VASILGDHAAIDLGFECAIVVTPALLLVALIGVPRCAEPRCRARGADARPALMATAVDPGSLGVATCACGADLAFCGAGSAHLGKVRALIREFLYLGSDDLLPSPWIPGPHLLENAPP